MTQNDTPRSVGERIDQWIDHIRSTPGYDDDLYSFAKVQGLLDARMIMLFDTCPDVWIEGQDQDATQKEDRNG